MLICICGSLDVVLDLSGYDVVTELLEPLQKLLDQCKSAKVLSRYAEFLFLFDGLLKCCNRKLVKRLDDLTQESAALKASIVPRLQALSNPVAELVNFGISVHCSVLFHKSQLMLTSYEARAADHKPYQRCAKLEISFPIDCGSGIREEYSGEYSC